MRTIGRSIGRIDDRMRMKFLTWLCWVSSTIFFAWAVLWVPEGSPQFFLVLLAIAHFVGGLFLVVDEFGD